MKKKLELGWGDECKIKIAKAGNKESFFYEAYCEAMAGVAEIVQKSNDYVKSVEKNRSRDEGCGFDGDSRLYNYPNNLIAFTGERGSGKSSAMMTFVDGLRGMNLSTGYEDTQRERFRMDDDFLKDMLETNFPGEKDYKEKIKNELKRCNFLPLMPIDPTAMEKDGQVLTILLARMYQMAKQNWEKTERRDRSTDKKNKLLKKFDECYQHVCVMKSMIPVESRIQGLEGLSQLGDSSSLKDELAELVKLFLDFCCGEENNQFLVVQLDDTDMNIAHAYEILEDVRRYMQIPRVIIIMAADINHLSVVVQNILLKSYNKDIYGVENRTRQIAQQYIVKLIPLKRQIELPNFGQYLREHNSMVTLTYTAGKQTVLPDKSKIEDTRVQILRMIYRKTGMLFLQDLIIPYNIRMLTHLLGLLTSMQDVVDIDNEDGYNFFNPLIKNKKKKYSNEKYVNVLKERIQNVQHLREYFVYTWAEHELEEEQAVQLQNLDQVDIKKKLETCLEIIGYTEKTSEINYSAVMKALRCWGKESRAKYKMEYAIHVCLSFLVHSIVLDDLVEFYSAGYEVEDQKKGCSFERLYSLLGSHVFEHKYAEGVYSVDKLEKGCIYAHWKCKLLDENTEPQYLTKQYLTMLYSMFLDAREKDNHADLSAAIVNCLYVTGNEKIAPGRSYACTSVLGGKGRIGHINEVDWARVQESAIMILANWDVQRFVQENILAVEEMGGKSPTPELDPEDKIMETNNYFDTILGISLDETGVSGEGATGINSKKWQKAYIDDREYRFDGFPQLGNILQNFIEGWGDLLFKLSTGTGNDGSEETTTAGEFRKVINEFFEPMKAN